MQPFTSHRTINGRVSRRAALLLGTALTAGVLSQGTFISGAYAANECGAPVNQAVVCDATNYQAAEGDIGYFNPGALTLTLQDLTVTANTAVRLTNSAVTPGDAAIIVENTDITTATGAGVQVNVASDSAATLTVNSGSSIVSGNTNAAFVRSVGGTVTVTTEAGTTLNGGANGLQTRTEEDNLTTVTIGGEAIGGTGSAVATAAVDGDTVITIEGTASLTGNGNSGIYADSNDGDITISTAAGSSVTTTAANDGYYAIEAASDTGTINMTLAGEVVEGGVAAFTSGAGSVNIDILGRINNAFGGGVQVETEDGDITLNLGQTDETGAPIQTVVESSSDALQLYSDEGSIFVTVGAGTSLIGGPANDELDEEGGDGIEAVADAGDITIGVLSGATITGGDDGIYASTDNGSVVISNAGLIGSVSEDEDGPVFSGVGDDGIDVEAYGDGLVEVVNEVGGLIFAEDNGIEVSQEGSGEVFVENLGSIGIFGNAVGDDGIRVTNYGTTSLDVTNGGAIWATNSAMDVASFIPGDVSILNQGLAIGSGQEPDEAVVRIRTVASTEGSEVQTALSFENTGIIASTDAANALFSFIEAVEDEDILAGGDLGTLLGSEAFSTFTADLGDAAEDFAIYAQGDDFEDEGSFGFGAGGEFTNSGLIVGRIGIDSFEASTFENNGLWLTRGDNSFGVGESSVLTNNVLIQTAFVSGVEDEASFSGLDVFQNNGVLSMIDNFGALAGIEGTPVFNNDRVRVDGTYQASGSAILAVDATLGAAGQSDSSDLLVVDDVDTGEQGVVGDSLTSILVLDSNASGLGALNLDGVALVRVNNGDAFLQNWKLNEGSSNYDSSRGVIDKGFVYYTLGERDAPEEISEEITLQIAEDNAREIVLIGLPDVEAYQAASIITGAQEIWHNTTAIYSERHADLRDFIMAGVNSRAERADLPVDGPAPTTTANNVTPGVWAKGFGGWVQNDGEAAGFDTGFDQDIYGMMAGIDTGRESVWSADDAILGGVFAGYLSSDLDFNTGGSSIDYEGFTVGGYASFLKGNFFVDATIKADFLEIEGAGGVFGDLSTDATSIGGTLESGYRFWFNRFFVEPNAVLAYVQTDIDDATVLGGDIDFADDAESLRGGVGIRVGGNVYTGMTHTVGVSLVGRAWNEFEGENQVTIGGEGGFDIVDQGPEDVYGELGGTLSVTSRTTGWSGQVSGSYKFNDEYESASVKGGVRYQW
ncbi:autotransporter domain-containing protein [Terrihabitans rhizophilus]|uniref:Autotransporter domain-containing protein n=1 Tax=Terrihabitans rhizophilus TaxID=3092662 RepID=A0ABU4RLJ2_9HYPH|nr:autotransporter domain-containing protein [Terrihabitans sp. PJ23]MDX6804969.1 autotransporter domain-containing protein [Terrihabitans sp. PJ23]